MWDVDDSVPNKESSTQHSVLSSYWSQNLWDELPEGAMQFIKSDTNDPKPDWDWDGPITLIVLATRFSLISPNSTRIFPQYTKFSVAFMARRFWSSNLYIIRPTDIACKSGSYVVISHWF